MDSTLTDAADAARYRARCDQLVWQLRQEQARVRALEEVLRLERDTLARVRAERDRAEERL